MTDWLSVRTYTHTGFPGGSVVKHLPDNARDTGLSPRSGRSLGERNASPLQYSCLGNHTDREAGGLKSRGSQKSWTWLNDETIKYLPQVSLYSKVYILIITSKSTPVIVNLEIRERGGCEKGSVCFTNSTSVHGLKTLKFVISFGVFPGDHQLLRVLISFFR